MIQQQKFIEGAPYAQLNTETDVWQIRADPQSQQEALRMGHTRWQIFNKLAIEYDSNPGNFDTERGEEVPTFLDRNNATSLIGAFGRDNFSEEQSNQLLAALNNFSPSDELDGMERFADFVETGSSIKLLNRAESLSRDDILRLGTISDLDLPESTEGYNLYKDMSSGAYYVSPYTEETESIDREITPMRSQQTVQ